MRFAQHASKSTQAPHLLSALSESRAVRRSKPTSILRHDHRSMTFFEGTFCGCRLGSPSQPVIQQSSLSPLLRPGDTMALSAAFRDKRNKALRVYLRS
jgi:hypothetical protein